MDSSISHDLVVLINNSLKEYNDMKEEINNLHKLFKIFSILINDAM